MKKATIIFALLFLAVAVGISFFSGSSTKPKNFPEKLNTRVILTDSEESIEYRMIEYADGGEKLIFIRTDFRDGTTVFDYFRNDGSLREEAEYFPVSDTSIDLSERQVKRVSLFDSTGKLVTARHVYREDGTSDSFTRLRVDGMSETETYSADGTAIVLRELKHANGKIQLREAYSPNGTYLVLRELHDSRGDLELREVYSDDGVLETTIRRNDDEIRIVQFQDDGIKRKSLTIRYERRSPRYGYGYGGYYYQRSPDYYLYQDNGVTLKMEVSYNSSSTHVKYFDDNGALIEKRVYSDYGRFTVTGYWPNGEKRFEQVWRGPGYKPDHTDISDFKLSDATQYDFDGKTTREVEFYDNGNPKVDRTYDGENAETGIKRHYSEDGFLEKEVEVTGWHEYGEEKVYGEEEGQINEKIEPDIPAELTELEEREPSPKESELPKLDPDEDSD